MSTQRPSGPKRASRRPPARQRSTSPSRWETRFSFFRRSIIIDGVCPLLGVGIVTYQTIIQSGLIPPYIAAMGLIGLPGVARLVGFLGGPK